MTVHFIGAGPGAADLITLRGRYLTPAAASMMGLIQEETRKRES